MILKHVLNRRNIIIALLLTAALCCSSVGAYADTIPASQQNEKLLVIGDSISTGYGLDGYVAHGRENTENYANLLKGKYSFSLTNRAIDGQTSAQLVSAFENGEYTSDISDCAVIIMSIGANDYIGALRTYLAMTGAELDFSRLSDSEYAASVTALFTSPKFAMAFSGLETSVYGNISRIISIVRKNNPSALIILHTVYNPFYRSASAGANESNDNSNSNDNGIIQYMNTCLEMLNTLIRQGAADGGYEYIDVFDSFAGKSSQLIIPGDIHPTASGHAIIAELCSEKIDVFLKEASSEAPDAEPSGTTDTSENDTNKQEGTSLTDTGANETDDTGLGLEKNESGIRDETAVIAAACIVLVAAAVAFLLIRQKKQRK